MSPVHYTTTDLYEAAYLMLMGCDVVGITKISPYSSAIVLTRQGILDFVSAYKAYQTVNFSARAYGEKREELKKLIKFQPQA